MAGSFGRRAGVGGRDVCAGMRRGRLTMGPASADVRIVNDPGGEVSSYVQKFQEMRASGERVVIDGPCLSACTLLTGFVPRDHVCVTSRAVLGFHAASYYDDASRSLVPTREGSRLVMRLYPPEIRVLDQPSWRIAAATDHAARPRTDRALPHLSVGSISRCRVVVCRPASLSAASSGLSNWGWINARTAMPMPEIAAPARAASGRSLAVGAAVALALAGTVLLWAHYGTTVFFETIRAGFAACFG